jgi:hypothetical protein
LRSARLEGDGKRREERTKNRGARVGAAVGCVVDQPFGSMPKPRPAWMAVVVFISFSLVVRGGAQPFGSAPRPFPA